MSTITANPQTDMSPVDALWTLIQGQSRNVRTVLSRLLYEQQVATEVNLSKAFDRLDHLATLEDGWAGKGSYAVSPQVLRNLRDVLLISDNDDWENWMISPAPDGTLGLQSKCHTSSISIGDKEFSYYSAAGDVEDWGDNVVFTPYSFLEIMRKIV